MVGVLGLLVLGAAGAGVALKIQHDNEVEAERVAAAEAREAEEREREAAEREQEAAEEERELQAELDDLEIGYRRETVRALRKSVNKDFRERVANGELPGPVLSTSCDPVSGGVTDLAETTGKFECLVATEELGEGRVRGYPVDATINYTKGSYTWQLAP